MIGNYGEVKIDFPVMVRSRKTSLNVTDKGIIVIQLELHPGNCLIPSGEVCLTRLTVPGVFEVDGDLGRGDNPQVHPGQLRPTPALRESRSKCPENEIVYCVNH